jgi:blue copper oxidase
MKLRLFLALLFASLNGLSQNPLFIPDTLSGKVFSLSVQNGTKIFFPGYNTPTYGYNGSFLGPTLIMNKGDHVTLNVTNNLNTPTTVHWHGFHVAPENDGGPHQIILPGATWSPAFKILNEASTFWYHPHGEGKTEIQISRGLAGLIIIRDSVEKNYTLPRRYGKDDFPLIVQSRAFDVLRQIATANHEDSIIMVNGTIDPFLGVPGQVVRLRLLNASADRTYLFGLSDNSDFYVIGSDGGLLSQPALTKRLRLSTGERAEILVNFGSYPAGHQLYLKSYASELPRGIIGADSVGTSSILISEGYYDNPLNGADFNILRFDVKAQTAEPVTTVPGTFAPRTPLPESLSVATRNLNFSPDTMMSGDQGYVDGPFLINNTAFDMDSVNIVTYLNNVEIWKLTNETMVAHPFHIHDIQFQVLDINRMPPPPEYSGLKDVILVKPGDTVRFITKFTTFSDSIVPYMYHCHLLHHEDEGMMGSFLVLDTARSAVNSHAAGGQLLVFPNPAKEKLFILLPKSSQNVDLQVFNMLGSLELKRKLKASGVLLQVDISSLNKGLYVGKITYPGGARTFKFLKD